MSFKDMVEADNKRVFLNSVEFAANHTIVYNGSAYSGIPVLMTKIKESERSAPADMQGIHIVTAVAHIALSDMDGIIPEQKQNIQIDDGTALGHPFFQKYKIVTSDCEAGMIILELEAYDE